MVAFCINMTGLYHYDPIRTFSASPVLICSWLPDRSRKGVRQGLKDTAWDFSQWSQISFSYVNQHCPTSIIGVRNSDVLFAAEDRRQTVDHLFSFKLRLAWSYLAVKTNHQNA